MEILISVFCFAVFFVLAFKSSRGAQCRRRERIIDSYDFPVSIEVNVRKKYPHLSKYDSAKVMLGLREYFHLCHQSEGEPVAMPSQVVDEAWHEFIVCTRDYQFFCSSALGRFLHHTPAEAMRTPTDAQEGIKRAWRLSCMRENGEATQMKKLPLLFALDSVLNIPDGFHYSLHCSGEESHAYCASHIGCVSGKGNE